MNWFKVTIHLRFPTATPWQADTIFGHLCWIVRYQDGEDALRRFLKPFLNGEPSFLLSDGFPAGQLPRPLTFTIPDDDSLEGFRRNRQLRRMHFFMEEDFLRAITGEVFEPRAPRKDEERATTRAVLKNQINRLTGTTGAEGRLFGLIEYWTPQVTIYLKVHPSEEVQVERLFRALQVSGYGKRRSVGYGAIERLEFNHFGGFPTPQKVSGFVSLSGFVPAENDPTEGHWRLVVKYGKLGEHLASSENPFKRPLVMLAPGSVFRDSPVREFYGRMVPDVSALPGVIHYGYALPVPLNIPEGVMPL